MPELNFTFGDEMYTVAYTTSEEGHLTHWDIIAGDKQLHKFIGEAFRVTFDEEEGMLSFHVNGPDDHAIKYKLVMELCKQEGVDTGF